MSTVTTGVGMQISYNDRGKGRPAVCHGRPPGADVVP